MLVKNSKDNEKAKEKRIKKLCLYGNFKNYYYERYIKRKKQNVIYVKNNDEEDIEEIVLYDNNIGTDKYNNMIDNNKRCDNNYDSENIYYIYDHRLNHINKYHKDIFKEKVILDIGCNCGIVSFLLGLNFECRVVNAIDIDNNIITKNIKLLRLFIEFIFIYNSERHMLDFFLKNKDISKIEIDMFKNIYFLYEKLKGSRNYYNKMNNIYNQDIITDINDPNTCDNSLRHFPLNIYFLCSDIFDNKYRHLNNTYDIILALSVIKWIHLNKGDEHLILFFDRVYFMLKQNGYFILEYNKEKKYKLRKIQKKYYKKNISLNYKNFDDIAQGKYNNRCKMILLNKFFFFTHKGDETSNKKNKSGMFNREVCIYRKV
ncbi:bicoid-interacting protein BIN3, putative [Plasmodium sp. gorilla clade G2]|uniref:bicoid-interacting protein BIN3, putative n=1 Tax=Plasmodium sp. gorilla clade G2 TaxID=880535 RepID=UPI000D201EAF|nr:bicoid-interacting protein BIN3, putative [Plasmodium sp. gorilla clade G2]SOV16126.1 bicoid-interacting protein BIN3, putative [Plasmodium sp. gorilla clade G2]